MYVAKFPEAVYVPHAFQKKDSEDGTERPGARQGSIPRSTDEEKVIMKTFVSVWDAIEDSQSEAASMKARAQLVRALQKTVRGWNLSQKASAERLGLFGERLSFGGRFHPIGVLDVLGKYQADILRHFFYSLLRAGR
jgi:hypothetical protein